MCGNAEPAQEIISKIQLFVLKALMLWAELKQCLLSPCCFISEIRIKIHLNKYPLMFITSYYNDKRQAKGGYLEIQFRSIDRCNKPLFFSPIWSSLIIQDGPIRFEIEKEFCVTIYNFDMFVFLFSHYSIHGTNPEKDGFILYCEEY